MKAKNIFASQTMWAIVLLLCQATLPKIQEDLVDNKIDLQETIGILSVLATAGVAVSGRYKVGDIYTPEGVPGRNKEDVKG